MAEKVEGWRGADGVVYETEKAATIAERAWAMERMHELGAEPEARLVSLLHEARMIAAFKVMVRLMPEDAGIVISGEATREQYDMRPITFDEVKRAVPSDDLRHFGGDTLEAYEDRATLPETMAEVEALDPTADQPGPPMEVHHQEQALRRSHITPTWVNDEVGGDAYAPQNDATEAERVEYVRQVHLTRARRGAPAPLDNVQRDLPLAGEELPQRGVTNDDEERSAIAQFSRG